MPPVGRLHVLHDSAVARQSNRQYGIVQVGEVFTNVAFFPLYPMLMRVLGPFVGGVIPAGFLISNLALLGGLIFLYLLAELETSAASAEPTATTSYPAALRRSDSRRSMSAAHSTTLLPGP